MSYVMCNYLQPSLMSALVLKIMTTLQEGHALEEASNPFPCIHWTILATGWKIMGPSSRIDIFCKNRQKSKLITTSHISHVS